MLGSTRRKYRHTHGFSSHQLPALEPSEAYRPAAPTIDNLKNICGFVIVGDTVGSRCFGPLPEDRHCPQSGSISPFLLSPTRPFALPRLRADGRLALGSSKARDGARGRPDTLGGSSRRQSGRPRAHLMDLRHERHRLTFVRMGAYRCNFHRSSQSCSPEISKRVASAPKVENLCRHPASCNDLVRVASAPMRRQSSKIPLRRPRARPQVLVVRSG